MKKQRLFAKGSIVAMALLAGTVSMGTAYAFGGASSKNLNEAQQEIVEQARELRAEGHYKAARKLMRELRDELQADRFARREAVREAIAHNDYDAFVAVVNHERFAHGVTPQIFARLVEAHSLREEGRIEEARAIFEELGVKHKHPRRPHLHDEE